MKNLDCNQIKIFIHLEVKGEKDKKKKIYIYIYISTLVFLLHFLKKRRKKKISSGSRWCQLKP